MKYKIFISDDYCVSLAMYFYIQIKYINESHSRYIFVPAIFTYGMKNVWLVVSAFIRLPRMFLSTDFLFGKWALLVAMDFLYIWFIYKTQDNQQA